MAGWTLLWCSGALSGSVSVESGCLQTSGVCTRARCSGAPAGAAMSDET